MRRSPGELNSSSTGSEQVVARGKVLPAPGPVPCRGGPSSKPAASSWSCLRDGGRWGCRDAPAKDRGGEQAHGTADHPAPGQPSDRRGPAVSSTRLMAAWRRRRTGAGGQSPDAGHPCSAGTQQTGQLEWGDFSSQTSAPAVGPRLLSPNLCSRGSVKWLARDSRVLPSASAEHLQLALPVSGQHGLGLSSSSKSATHATTEHFQMAFPAPAVRHVGANGRSPVHQRFFG